MCKSHRRKFAIFGDFLWQGNTASLFNQISHKTYHLKSYKIEPYNSIKINRIRQIFFKPMHAKVGLPFFYTHCILSFVHTPNLSLKVSLGTLLILKWNKMLGNMQFGECGGQCSKGALLGLETEFWDLKTMQFRCTYREGIIRKRKLSALSCVVLRRHRPTIVKWNKWQRKAWFERKTLIFFTIKIVMWVFFMFKFLHSVHLYAKEGVVQKKNFNHFYH